MEMFRETALGVFWPICILLWTIMGAISVLESIGTHRHKMKILAQRLDKLERQQSRSNKRKG